MTLSSDLLHQIGNGADLSDRASGAPAGDADRGVTGDRGRRAVGPTDRRTTGQPQRTAGLGRSFRTRARGHRKAAAHEGTVPFSDYHGDDRPLAQFTRSHVVPGRATESACGQSEPHSFSTTSNVIASPSIS